MYEEAKRMQDVHDCHDERQEDLGSSEALELRYITERHWGQDRGIKQSKESQRTVNGPFAFTITDRAWTSAVEGQSAW
jgi:hypothetical protein